MSTPQTPIVVIDPSSGKEVNLVQFAASLPMDCPSAPVDQVAQILASRRAGGALTSISASLLYGAVLDGSDVKALTPEHWMRIYQEGDNYLRSICAAHEQELRRKDEWDDICGFRGRTTRSFPCTGRSLDCPFRSDENVREHQRGRSRGYER